MIDLTQADHNQISASNASCFWIRFLSLNPYYLSHIDALFNLHPQFLKIIHEELKVLALSNAVDLSLEFRLNVQINAFHEKFYDFCQIATIEELKDFFNHCLMTDIYLANLFPLGLDFASVLNNLEQIHQGPQGAFIVNLILAEHPKFIHLKERLHIDYALSKLSHLKQDLSQSEFIENIKIQLSNFPVKKKQYLGSSISFIDVDLLVDWLTKKCPENRSLQSLYFWKTLFSLYPHYKNYETIKQLFLIYNEESKGILKNYLDSLNVSP
jgi:hypothetical protein